MQKHLDIIRQRPVRSSKWKKPTKRQLLVIALSSLAAIAAIAGFFTWKNASSSSAYIQTDKYQAIFLQNNQVYFGKLHQLNDNSYRMTDVFYVQQPTATPSADSTSQAATDPAKQSAVVQPSLVKLGEELHGPEDEIIVKDSQVLFWENLKPDGKVVKAIQEYKKKQ